MWDGEIQYVRDMVGEGMDVDAAVAIAGKNSTRSKAAIRRTYFR